MSIYCSSHPLANPLPGNSTIKLFLEKQINEGTGIPQNAEYNEIKTIYETTHDFLTNGNFHYSGVYTPQPIEPGGWYRLKLEVTAPNGLKETNRYNYFYYFQSGFNVGLGPINQDGKSFKYLIPGASYTIPIKIQKPTPIKIGSDLFKREVIDKSKLDTCCKYKDCQSKIIKYLSKWRELCYDYMRKGGPSEQSASQAQNNCDSKCIGGNK